MLNLERVQEAGLQVVRRFSGGGTVVVDQDTCMVSFIFGAAAAPDVPCFPAPLMAWSERFYSGVFHDSPDFRLRENGATLQPCSCSGPPRSLHGLTRPCLRRCPDYVFGERKFGGNAQSITKMRWVHHTSFLWDYKAAHMQCLQHPPRTPEYRQVRERVHGCDATDAWHPDTCPNSRDIPVAGPAARGVHMQAARQVVTPLAAWGPHCGQASRMRLRCEGVFPRGGQPGAGDTPSEQQRAAGCGQSELLGGMSVRVVDGYVCACAISSACPRRVIIVSTLRGVCPSAWACRVRR